MAEKIKLVQGDDLPYINLALTAAINGTPIDVSAPEIVVRVYFRPYGAASILSTIVCQKTDPINGQVRFNFAGGVLDVEPGPYEGEIEIDFNGQTQTIYDTLKFIVRAQF